MFARRHRLNNLTVVVDRNNIQIDGNTEEVMPLEPFADKYKAFGWNVLEIDGHNIREFVSAVTEAEATYEAPTVIVAVTMMMPAIARIRRDEVAFMWRHSL